jgi:hypothetical protein
MDKSPKPARPSVTLLPERSLRSVRGGAEDSSVALKQHVDNPGQTPMTTVGNP